MLCSGTMPAYDLRAAFPLRNHEFTIGDHKWICKLAEVSDLRPAADLLSWYLVFEPAGRRDAHAPQADRKLEIVTSADHLIKTGFGADLGERIEQWLITGEEDGRREWIDY